MDDIEPPEWLTRADGTKLAFRFVRGKGPAIVFLPGYMSDMQGTKALAIEAWAIKHGRAILRFDYAGCGESEGAFEDQTIESWRDDAILAIELIIRGPVILIGSSMGGWLMVLIALVLQSDVKAIMGIAAAPDFTEWGFTPAQKGMLQKRGRLEQPSPYGTPLVTTMRLWQSGHANQVLTAEIPIDCPVRLLHGEADEEVPTDISVQLAARLRSADVQVTIVKDGDHRLSREEDIFLILSTLESLITAL
jgi:pimeloyl-ACP methyl ester carboxylesterase